MRVSANGGTPELIVKTSDDERVYGPQWLPDGEHVLFTVARETNWDKAQIVVQSLRTGERKTLIDGGTDGRYLPTGHIVYALGGVVLGIRFDSQNLQVVGGPVPIIEGVRRNAVAAHFSVSDHGSLVYIPGPVGTAGLQVLGLVDQKGVVELLKMPVGAYRDPRISPDGKQVAFGSVDGNEVIVWVYELAGATSMRRLTQGGRNRHPVWSPDGKRVAFQSDREGDAALFWQPADGSGTAERLTKPEPGTTHVPESWSPDGKSLLFGASSGSDVSLQILSLDDRKVRAFGNVLSRQPVNATFSPDGKWVAYTSQAASGSVQIYVQPFPPTGATYQVRSPGGIIRSGRVTVATCTIFRAPERSPSSP